MGRDTLDPEGLLNETQTAEFLRVGPRGPSRTGAGAAQARGSSAYLVARCGTGAATSSLGLKNT